MHYDDRLHLDCRRAGCIVPLPTVAERERTRIEESASGCILMKARAGNSCPEDTRPADHTQVGIDSLTQSSAPHGGFEHDHVRQTGSVTWTLP